MSRPVAVIKPEEHYLTAADVMRRRRIKRLPVAKQGKLLGIVSLSDLAKLAVKDVGQIKSSLGLLSSFLSAVEIQSRTNRRTRPEIEPSTRADGTQTASRKTSPSEINQEEQVAQL
ncbi:MAG TPA: CBS domain-containing protein [Candidatus Binatia bacterium]|nr:CBS domain-containing protein [Candidatus Binatia bacterium]